NVFDPLFHGGHRGLAFFETHFNADGTIFVNNEGGLHRYSGPINQQYNIVTGLTGNGVPLDQRREYDGLKWNNLEAYASAPQDRHSFFASGHFDVADGVRVYARATFAESETRTLLQGTNAVSGWEVYVPYNPTTDS